MNNDQIKKSSLKFVKSTLLLTILGAVSLEAQAALPADAILAFNPGVTGGYYGYVVSGSYFAMDFNGDGAFGANEKTAMTMVEGVRLGDVQPALGSHGGAPDGSELPSVDAPWSFFGSTGMHQTTSPTVIVNGDDGSGDNIASVDFSGWGVTWNGIPNIPLGGDSANFPADAGVAVITCASECNVGDSYSLDYVGHIPSGGFTGVFYTVHLEGVVSAGSALPPTKSVSIQLTVGSLHECSSPDGSVIEATANIITTDVNDIVSVSWTLDGDDAGTGETVNISSSLGSHVLNVFVDTLASGTFDSSASVTVNDHTAPELDIVFVDSRSGSEVTEISGAGVHFVTVRYDVVDVCDPEASASGVAVPVHAIESGDIIKIKNRKLSTAELGASAINVSADAVDASGNNRHRSATLLIAD